MLFRSYPTFCTRKVDAGVGYCFLARFQDVQGGFRFIHIRKGITIPELGVVPEYQFGSVYAFREKHRFAVPGHGRKADFRSNSSGEKKGNFI